MIEDILKSKYGEYLKGLDIYENKNSLILSRIVMKTNEGGVGTQIMNDLVSYADSNKQIVALSPSSDFGGNKNRLIQFYKRFGFKHNKGVHKNYEFRDTMIRYPKLSEGMEKDKVKGGLADGMSKKDLAKKHSVSLKDINSQLSKGITVELEHTSDRQLAKEIAMDHIFEDPKYYDKLETIEESTQRQFIRKLIKENIDLSVTDETTDSKTFDIYYNKRKAGHIKCGPAPIKLGEDTHEIDELYLEDEYTNLNVAVQAINSLWSAHPDINRFIVSLPNESYLFWEKLGFQRLNDSYHMLMRGH